MDGLLFSDGSELKADVIVFATGFIGNLRKVVRGIFGEDVHDRVEDFWGLNPEGELYGAFKPTGREFLDVYLFGRSSCILYLLILWQIRACGTLEVH